MSKAHLQSVLGEFVQCQSLRSFQVHLLEITTHFYQFVSVHTTCSSSWFFRFLKIEAERARSGGGGGQGAVKRTKTDLEKPLVCWVLADEMITVPITRNIIITIGNRKGDCAWSCSRWQTQPEKICKSQRTNQCHSLRTFYWFVLCNLQIFSGCVCYLEQLHAQSPFLFPIVFSINLIPFFDISSVLAVHSPGLFGYVLLYFTWATARSQELLFVVLACHALRALDSSCRLRTRRRVCICIGSTRCRGNHMHDHSRFQRDIDDVTGVSLSLSTTHKSHSRTI